MSCPYLSGPPLATSPWLPSWALSVQSKNQSEKLVILGWSQKGTWWSGKEAAGREGWRALSPKPEQPGTVHTLALQHHQAPPASPVLPGVSHPW